jgi:ubiquitin C-terminal hydrolase
MSYGHMVNCLWIHVCNVVVEADDIRKPELSSAMSPLSPLHPDGVLRLNSGGKVGLDNLGNTCYMNSSLQALLHTAPLVEYFLTKTHLREINRHSKFGFKGRLAFAFGKLVSELWVQREEREKDKNSLLGSAASSALSTLKRLGGGGGDTTGISVSPRKFRKELMALHDQFANNEQHDAQEVRPLMVFPGLSLYILANCFSLPFSC